MDSNLDIYEPLRLAGSSVTSSVRVPTPESASTEDVPEDIPEDIPEDVTETDLDLLEESSGTVEKQETLEDLWKVEEMPGEYDGEEEGEEEYMEEEELESMIEWPECVSPPSTIAEEDKVGWPAFRLADEPWAEGRRPVVTVLNYDDFELTEGEEEGVLSDRMVSACSSHLDRNPETGGHCLARLQLKCKGLTDITILEAHRYLQYVDLSWNRLTDLYPLSGVPYLMYLDASNNYLAGVLRFKAPWNLTYVDISYNYVEKMDDLTDFWSLEFLNLSHNEITTIEGLQNLRYLTELDLSFNKIERLENLNNLRIQNLNLESNQISSFEEGPEVGLKTMPYLYYINLSSNQLSSLALFEGVYHVRVVVMRKNIIEDLMETDHLKTMHLLQELDLAENPLTQWDKYREILFHTVPSLCYLDQTDIRTLEKVAAQNLFAPSEILSAARDHSRLVLLEELNCPSLELDTLPVDQGPYPLVVLVGPPGSGKEDLIASLISHFPDKIHSGVCHTSREKEPEETEGVDYHFVTQAKFNELTRKGLFLCINEFLGASYGFSRMEVAEAVKRKKLCVTHMDLVCALTLNNRGIQPHLVLIMLESEDLHLDRLREKYEAVMYEDKSYSLGAVSVRKRSAYSTKSAYSMSGSQKHSRSATTIAGNILESILWEKVLASFPSITVSSLKTESIKEEVLEEKPSPTKVKQPHAVKTVRMAGFEDSAKSLSEAPANMAAQQSDKSMRSHKSMMSWGKPQPLTNENVNLSASGVGSTVETVGMCDDYNKDNKSNKSVSAATPHNKGRPTKQAFSCSEVLNTVGYDNSTSLMEADVTESFQEQTQEVEETFESGCSNTASTTKKSSLKSTYECTSIYSSACGSETNNENHGESSGENVIIEEGTDDQMFNVEASWQQQTANWTESDQSIENVEEIYVRSILKTRDAYFKVHLENPGIFSETVYTDDSAKAFHKLYKHIRETFISRPAQRPIFKFEDDPAYKLMIPRRLELFKQDIYRGHSIMEKQIDATPKPDTLQPTKQRSTYKIVGDMENQVPKLHSRKCNLNY